MNWRSIRKMARFTQRVELSFHKNGLKGLPNHVFKRIRIMLNNRKYVRKVQNKKRKSKPGGWVLCKIKSFMGGRNSNKLTGGGLYISIIYMPIG
jgi:hypothetical protein